MPIRSAYAFWLESCERYLMTAQDASLFLEFLYIIRLEPPTKANDLPLGPFGSGAMPTFLRAASVHLGSSARVVEPSTHGPPIQTASWPPLNMSSTPWPSFSRAEVSNTPSRIRFA